MRDGIVATIQTPLARVGFDSNRSGIGIRVLSRGVSVRPMQRTPRMAGLSGSSRDVRNTVRLSLRHCPTRTRLGRSLERDVYLDHQIILRRGQRVFHVLLDEQILPFQLFLVEIVGD